LQAHLRNAEATLIPLGSSEMHGSHMPLDGKVNEIFDRFSCYPVAAIGALRTVSISVRNRRFVDKA
jgi:hypothetical protein